MFSFFHLHDTKDSLRTMRRKAIVISVAVLVLLGGSFAAGYSFARIQERLDGSLDNFGLPALPGNLLQKNSQIPPADFSLMQDVWNRIHSDYVGRQNLDDSALMYGAIKGMVGALNDPYTLFFTPDETKNFLSDVNGKFDGIGAQVDIHDGKITIVAPLKNTPAERAGLQAGDIILSIDGQNTSSMSLDEAVAKIRGEAGTKVTLALQRQGIANPITISIVRATINVPSMDWKINSSGIAVISFYEFSENAPQDFQNAANDILSQHAKGIVLDMRNNPGGYLDAAVNIAGYLLPQNSLVVTEDFGNGQKTEHRTTGSGQLKNIPMVVVLNKGSASAAEILAGALEDDRNIQIVGEQSFGKGSVQELDNLAGNTSLKMTIAHWLTPSGRSIQGQGITPTVPVAMPANATTDVQLQKALDVLQQQLTK